MSGPAENEEYLTKIRQAEQLAARYAPGSFEHQSWVAIAEGYRRLLEELHAAAAPARAEQLEPDRSQATCQAPRGGPE